MQATRIFDILENYKSKYPNKKDALSAKVNGQWVNYSSKDYIETANYVSYGLLSMGFKPQDKIATVSNNRPEWNFMDMGMLQIGVVHVPIYPTISETEYEHILKHSEAKMIIVSSVELYEKIKPVINKLGGIEIYSFDKIAGVKHWSEITEMGKSAEGPELRGKVKLIKDDIKKEDLATIIYTSGTTGLPKGVMLSHWNFMYQVHRIDDFLNVDSSHKALSFLPLCHVLERIGGYVWQYRGLGIYYAESIEKISENIKEIKPQAFITVPRLLERIYDKIIGIGKDLEGAKKNLFFWAVDLGLQYKDHGNSFVYLAKLKVANALIFKKWREALGGNVRLIIAGGAALQPRLARVFTAAGIPVHEGYGLTETAPVIAVNRFKYPELMFGTVGPKLGDEQEIKIAEDGEILFKGPNLMLGYYKDEEKTREAIDADGWFHTGDIGEMVGNNLKITDRKKEIFKLSTGKYVAPQVVENIFKESLFIEQLMVIGANEKYTAALISPHFEFLHDWCHKKKIKFRDNKDLIENPQVIARYQEEVDFYNKRLGKTEQIKKFELVCEEWTPDNGELSPTLKLKRRFVKEKYKHKIERIYKE